MLPRRLLNIQSRFLRSGTQIHSCQQLRTIGSRTAELVEAEYPRLSDLEDPGMNGGYINPPRVKRHFRDPYADWWDKQERRNFGEPVHEDNDILGMLSPHEYNHVEPRTAIFQIGCFITTVFGLMGAVYLYYPDKPSVAKRYEGGLQKELGGLGAVGARARETD